MIHKMEIKFKLAMTGQRDLQGLLPPKSGSDVYHCAFQKPSFPRPHASEQPGASLAGAPKGLLLKTNFRCARSSGWRLGTSQAGFRGRGGCLLSVHN